MESNVTGYSLSLPDLYRNDVSIFGIIGMCIIAILVLMILGNWDSYLKMRGLLGKLFRSFGLFLYGFLTLIILGVPCTLFYLVSQYCTDNPHFLMSLFKWIGIIMGGYGLLVVVGWITRPIYKRISDNHRNYEKKGVI